MTDPQLLEIAMLISFSVGWYASIFHMLRTGEASGKSRQFIMLVTIGYAFGCAAKLAVWHDGGALSWVFYVYFWNGLVCLADLFLVMHFTRRSRQLAHPA
ncbi:MAG: hypothetical protein AAF577_12225 [Pseudomonadota bacterium]